jgi:glyoxylase I family protein
MPIPVNSATPLIAVYDVPTSVAFYRDIIGFEVLQTSKPFTSAKDDFGWCYLRLNSVTLMLNNAYENNIRPPRPDPTRIAAHTDVCLYIDCPDVDAAYAHLRAHGTDATEPKVAYYGLRQTYVTDPDGYKLCFQWPAEPA